MKKILQAGLKLVWFKSVWNYGWNLMLVKSTCLKHAKAKRKLLGHITDFILTGKLKKIIS